MLHRAFHLKCFRHIGAAGLRAAVEKAFAGEIETNLIRVISAEHRVMAGGAVVINQQTRAAAGDRRAHAGADAVG